MRHDIRNKPDYASLHLELDSGDAVVTEAGAMMAMDPALQMKSSFQGGLFAAAKRMVGGESLVLNTYTATGAAQRLDLAPSTPGDVVHVPLAGTLFMQSGSFLAATPGVSLDTKWNGMKGFFSGEGLFLLKAEGQGDLWLSSYGAIEAIDVDGSYVVDTSHIVAFESSLTYRVTRSGGMKSLFLSGEGLVCAFSGRGRLWFQTRSGPSLASFLHPFRRVKQRNDD
jgi:uncharacterized protein (TIGR00266 family)